ncbi:MAG: hypothetical protein JW788_04270 [Candidatus Omnitrophica bacterium]|nr:hypothetical protein [Candidatus Omnitrophota bacterium]
MAEDIKGLIEKINQEGIKAAEEKAAVIIAEAKKGSEEIISQAKKESQRLLDEAKDRIAQEDAKEKALLAQAARDMLLALRQEIGLTLDKIIRQETESAFTPEIIIKVISELLKNQNTTMQGVTITLNEKDAQALEKGALAKLKEQVKKEIILRPSQQVNKGFLISFDAGKSQFEFTDKAISEYIGSYLKPKLKDLLEQAIK